MADERGEVGARTGTGDGGVVAPPGQPLGSEDETTQQPVVGADPAVIVPIVEQHSLSVRLFGSRAFFRLWIAQVVSSLGDWVGFVATVALAERIGGSSPETAIGLVMSARIVPGFFLAQLAGVLVDRWDRKKTMVVCDVVRAGVLATFPFLTSVWQLVLASLVLEVATLLWSPAKEASVPNLVPQQHLTTANSLSLVAAYGTFPVASLLFAAFAKLAEWLGGFDALDFLALNQESIAIYFDVLTFFTAAALISTLPLTHRKRAPAGDGKRIDMGAAFRELKEGWHFIFLNPVVRGVMVAVSTGLIGGGMLVPLGPVFAEQALGAGQAGFGLLLTALGFGMAIGVVLLSALQKRVPKAQVFSSAVLGAGGCLLAGASMTTLAPAFTFVLGLGVCAGAVYVLGFTILHATVEDELRGRIFSTLYTLVRLCVLIAFAVGPLASGLFDRFSEAVFGEDRSLEFGITLFLPGVRLTLWLAAVIILVSGVLAVWSFRQHGDRERLRQI